MRRPAATAGCRKTCSTSPRRRWWIGTSRSSVARPSSDRTSSWSVGILGLGLILLICDRFSRRFMRDATKPCAKDRALLGTHRDILLIGTSTAVVWPGPSPRLPVSNSRLQVSTRPRSRFTTCVRCHGDGPRCPGECEAAVHVTVANAMGPARGSAWDEGPRAPRRWRGAVRLLCAVCLCRDWWKLGAPFPQHFGHLRVCSVRPRCWLRR